MSKCQTGCILLFCCGLVVRKPCVKFRQACLQFYIQIFWCPCASASAGFALRYREHFFPSRLHSQTRWTNFSSCWEHRDFSSSSVLCFMETWLSGPIPDSVLQLAGGICFYMNSGWCIDVTVILQHCPPVLESFIDICKPFYSPREFAVVLGDFIKGQTIS